MCVFIFTLGLREIKAMLIAVTNGASQNHTQQLNMVNEYYSLNIVRSNTPPHT